MFPSLYISHGSPCWRCNRAPAARTGKACGPIAATQGDRDCLGALGKR